MLLYSLIFCTIFTVFMLCMGLGRAVAVSQEKARLRVMLKRASASRAKQQAHLIRETDQSAWETYLDEAGWLEPIRRLIRQANVKLPIRSFVLFTLSGFVAAYLFGRVLPMISQYSFGPWVLGVIAASLPFFIVNRARRKRLSAFEEQFAGGLEFLARSLRAGHAFTIGLEMMVADAQEPLAGCFRRVMQTLQLGSPLEVALVELSDSVPTVDVRFFVSAVLLQQGTGGNLGEILDTMSNVIRARFKLKGAVKAASAHGRITGLVLTLMPIGMAVAMLMLSPQYIFQLVADPMGQKMLWGAAIGQVLGYLCINKITDIKG